MLETWRKFNPRKVAILLRQHCKLLKSELRTIEGLLAAPNETNHAIVAEHIKTLRLHCRRALTDHVEASKAMCRSIVFLDFLNYPVVIKAQSDLLATANEVLSLVAERAAPDEPSKEASGVSFAEPILDVDFDTLYAACRTQGILRS